MGGWFWWVLIDLGVLCGSCCDLWVWVAVVDFLRVVLSCVLIAVVYVGGF